jgi:radical SAM superfamily enzyme YgiQ (UPF0313 family)
LLLSCYELGHQPLALAAPLRALEGAGFSPDALDLSVEELSTDKVKRASFAAISVPMHTALRLGVRAAERVREINPECRLLFYGLYAALNAPYLRERFSAFVIGPEWEAPLVALLEALASGNAETQERRVGEWESGRVGASKGQSAKGKAQRASPNTRTPEHPDAQHPTPNTQHLHVLPPLERYARLERNGRLELAGYVEATRGCKHRCLHCPIPSVYDGRFVVVPRETVLEDVRRMVRLGAAHVTFGDPDFLNGPGHSLRIVRQMRVEFPHLTFDVTAKVEHLLKHRSLLPELAALGCVFIVSAVESLSDRVLRNLEKGHTRADVGEALALTRAAGIALRPSLMPFTPWSTLEDYRDLLRWVAEEDLVGCVDPVQLSIRLLVPPGSLLLQSPAMQPYLGELQEAAFSYRWAHPDPRVDRLHQDVSRAVEEAARADEEPRTTFARLWELAKEEGGRRKDESYNPFILHSSSFILPKPPRLTESWFC